MRAPSTVSTLLTLLATLVACAESSSPKGASVGESATNDGGEPDANGWDGFELGTWDGQFQPLSASGNAFMLVAGPQGGYHIDIAGSFETGDIDGVKLEIEALPLEGGAPITHPLSRELDARRVLQFENRWVWTGGRLIFESVDPQQIVGLDIEVRAHAERAERIATASARGMVLPL